MLGATAEAEDAAQEAILRIWRRRDSCRTPEDPLPWVAAIARNEALRRGARRAEVVLAEVPEGADRAVDEQFDSAVARVDLAAALTPLSPTERALVRLRYGADLTQPAVAALLGMPEGTVKVRLHRLRQKLLKRLTSP